MKEKIEKENLEKNERMVKKKKKGNERKRKERIKVRKKR